MSKRREDAMVQALKREEAKECRWPLEAGKGKETDSPLELPEGIQSWGSILDI